MNSLLIFSLFVTISATPPKGHQPPSPPDKEVVFKKLSEAIEFDALFKSVQPGSKETREFIEAWEQMSDSTHYLEEARRNQTIPPDYLRSLMGDVAALNKVKTGGLTISQKLHLCQIVARDLKIKANYTKRQIENRCPFCLVKVIAHPKDRNNNDVPGVEICYLALSSDFGGCFTQFSNPTTTEDLAPGEYNFWTRVRNPEGQYSDGPRRDLTIGEKDPEVIDLRVPDK